MWREAVVSKNFHPHSRIAALLERDLSKKLAAEQDAAAIPEIRDILQSALLQATCLSSCIASNTALITRKTSASVRIPRGAMKGEQQW